MSFTYKSLEHHLDGLRKKYADAVDNIIKAAAEASEDVTFTIDFADVPGDFDMREDRYLILEMLCEHDEIIQADVHGYGFDLELNPQYCQCRSADTGEPESPDEDEDQGMVMQ